ncbi:MAG TPA: outer membrane beta-barrel protein [Gallionellaceae bacterium]
MSIVSFIQEDTKMNNLAKILVTATIAVAICGPAWADGFVYGAADVGQSAAADACVNVGPAGSRSGCKDTAGAFRLALGFQFVPMLGAEASYGYYGSASLGASSGDWKASGLQVSGIGNVPLGDGFFLTAKLGIAATRLELSAVNSSVTSTNLAFGIGARYDFTRDVAVRAQYENLGDVGDATTGTTRLTLVSAGIVLKF